MKLIAGDKVDLVRQGKKPKRYEVIHVDDARIYVMGRKGCKVYRLAEVTVNRVV